MSEDTPQTCERCGNILTGPGRPYCEDTGYKDTCRTADEAAEINRRNQEVAKTFKKPPSLE
jgi:hypothetical protein